MKRPQKVASLHFFHNFVGLPFNKLKMSHAKSLMIAVLFILYAVSASAQTAVSDTLDLKIRFDRTSSELEPLVRDSVFTIDEILSLLKEYDTKTVNVHITLDGGAPSSAYVLRDSIPEVTADTVFVTQVVTQKREWKDRISQTPVFAARTNAMAIPLLNAGVEVPIGKHWSVGADYYYPWIWRGKNYQNCNQLLAFDVEGRYWFEDKKYPEQARLLGHSVGAYFGAGYFDFERNWAGHQGEFISTGVDYLYALPLFGGMIHLEFELGLGYIYSRAVPYRFVNQECYLDKNITRHIHWVGPTRAQVSVAVPIHITKEQWGTFCGKVDSMFDGMFDTVFKGKSEKKSKEIKDKRKSKSEKK